MPDANGEQQQASYTGGLGITSNPYGPLPDEVGYNVSVSVA
jgi:hypothetical protein